MNEVSEVNLIIDMPIDVQGKTEDKSISSKATAVAKYPD